VTRELVVRGARQHNLQNVDVTIPRDQLVVITGPSGSGKSSLAFDTIYAEGQRRYVESLSAYARQFLDRMPKPDVDRIEGLSPAIAIQQQAPSRNPRSTVGTVTEIYDYLRLLYARVGVPHCPSCGREVVAQTVQEIVDLVLGMPSGTRFSVLAPVVRGRKGQLKKVLADLRRQGFVRVRLDGDTLDLGDEIKPDARVAHSLDVFVDRLSVKPDVKQRLTESVELALGLADGLVRISPAGGVEQLLSERHSCAECAVSLPELTPRTFSFNSPAGACPACNGLGEMCRFVAELVVPDEQLSLRRGAVAAWGRPGGAYHRFMLERVAEQLPADADVAWADLPVRVRETLLNGAPDAQFEGILPGLERRSREYERRKREEGRDEERTFEFIEDELGRFARRDVCGTCAGARLRPEALAVTVDSVNIRDLCGLSVADAARFFDGKELTGRDGQVAEPVIREIVSRLGFLNDVGLDYLSLDRATATLSGGEVERVRLATQIGAGLVGVLYVLDEPSIGLHPRDNARLVRTLLSLRDRGNTVLVVEHDRDTIREADHIVDMGPGAGRLGGRVVAQGSPAEISAHPDSITGAFLSGRRRIAMRETRRTAGRRAIGIKGARIHNLKGIRVEIPLGLFVCVTGVSGSGKSSLVVDTLLPAVRASLGGRSATPQPGLDVTGVAELDKVIEIDQGPIGRTPRSNPATYTGVFSDIREVFASLKEARARGYRPGRFSFNVKGGRCEACRGDGLVRIEMHFLPDVYVQCEECAGQRYNRETLEVHYRGSSIADVLRMTADEASGLFGVHQRIRDRLDTIRAVGLGYVELGQSATTLSGGEAQRLKLSRELAKKSTGRTLYVLDEPTTGLHACDVEVLLSVLQELVDAGNTVIVIEHNLDVIKVADHVIDLGPEGGNAGGELVAAGTPEQVADVEASHTGRHLRDVLDP